MLWLSIADDRRQRSNRSINPFSPTAYPCLNRHSRFTSHRVGTLNRESQSKMNDIEVVRQSLLSCLREALPSTTPEGNPSVLDPSARQVWTEATLPYNIRLADAIGPLALVYRMYRSSAKTDRRLMCSSHLGRYSCVHPMRQNQQSPSSSPLRRPFLWGILAWRRPPYRQTCLIISSIKALSAPNHS